MSDTRPGRLKQRPPFAAPAHRLPCNPATEPDSARTGCDEFDDADEWSHFVWDGLACFIAAAPVTAPLRAAPLNREGPSALLKRQRPSAGNPRYDEDRTGAGVSRTAGSPPPLSPTRARPRSPEYTSRRDSGWVGKRRDQAQPRAKMATSRACTTPPPTNPPYTRYLGQLRRPPQQASWRVPRPPPLTCNRDRAQHGARRPTPRGRRTTAPKSEPAAAHTARGPSCTGTHASTQRHGSSIGGRP